MATAGDRFLAEHPELAPDECEACPWCHHWFRAPAGHDPLKRHMDYCEARPYTEGDDE